MKYLVQFSGGVCSFWAAHRAIEKHGKENVVLLFADTKTEEPDLYRFNRDAERVFGIRITVKCDGRNVWQVFHDERMIGNSRADMCSRILKRDLLRKHIFDNYTQETATLYFGMDFTEAHRIERVKEIYQPFAVDAPMCWEPLWDKCKMLEMLRSVYSIEPPQLYKDGFSHGNCGGFCIKAGQAHFAHLLKTRPETYAYHEEQERQMREYLGKDVSVLKDRRGGTTKPMTLAAFRLRVETGDFDHDEWGGCGCAVS